MDTYTMMTTLAIAALLGGYLCGMRFKVFVLIPVIMLSIIAITVIGIALNSSVSSIVLAAVLATIALQAGYLASAALYFIMPRGASAKYDLKKLRWDRGQ
jgi:hypothetical protein